MSTKRVLGSRVLWLALLALACVMKVAWSHVDSPLLLDGCGSCHVGHGKSGEPMLSHSEEQLCYMCHGSDGQRAEMVSAGRLSAAANPSDIESVFRKPYRHPVEEGGAHSPDERLPTYQGAVPTHAECSDCHNPHQRIEGGRHQTFEVTGYSMSGQYLETSLYEYQICLKCHTESRGIETSTRPSLINEFATTGGSRHPVMQGGSGNRLASLSRSTGQAERMNCSDCHTNDNPNGPRGPHGSNHRAMLSGNYNTDPFADESPYAYEFCYSCHERSSILANESFPSHREHIEGDPLSGRSGTSCYTCHASHGSVRWPHLLRFNPSAVGISPTAGLVHYQDTGEQRGECYLSCHGHDHGPERY